MSTLVAEPPPIKKRKASTEPTAPVVASEPTITARDVIGPDRQYGRHALCELLGISIDTIDGALRAREFLHHAGSGVHVRLLGSDVLGWLERSSIPVHPPAAVAARIAAKRSSDAKADEPQPKDTFTQLRELEDNAREADADEHRRLLSRYVVILQRFDAPHPDDGEVLKSLMFHLGIAAESNQSDAVAGTDVVLQVFDQLADVGVSHRWHGPGPIGDNDNIDPLAAHVQSRSRQGQQQQRQQAQTQPARRAGNASPASERKPQRNGQQEQFGKVELDHEV